MSEEQDPKFMKPGDDPVLDRALNELRFDSGLYQRGEYDLFGRQRALGPGAEGAAGAAEEKPAAVPGAAPSRAVGRKKIGAGVLAVMAALVPVVVFSMVWKPSEGPATKMTAGVGTTAASVAPEAAAVPQVVMSVAPVASALPTASAAATAVSPMVTPSSAPLRQHPMPKRPRSGDDPYGDAAPPSPAMTVQPQATAAPIAPPPPQKTGDPPAGPVPMFKREQ